MRIPAPGAGSDTELQPPVREDVGGRFAGEQGGVSEVVAVDEAPDAQGGGGCCGSHQGGPDREPTSLGVISEQERVVAERLNPARGLTELTPVEVDGELPAKRNGRRVDIGASWSNTDGGP